MGKVKDIKKQIVIIGIAVLLICVGLSGCNEINGQNEEDKFIGTWSWTQSAYFISGWRNITGNITFFENGTVKHIYDDSFNKSKKKTTLGEYVIADGLLIIQFNEQDTLLESNYSFYDNNQKLILSNSRGNSTVILIKKNEYFD